MPITSYADIGSTPYEAGQVVYLETPVIRTFFNEETSTIIPFGFAVVQGAGANGALLPVDGNSVFRGVAVAVDSFEKRASYSLNSDSRFGYPIDKEMSVLVRGVIAVLVDQAVAAGSTSVFWRHTASGDERKGVFRADADTSDAVAVTGGRWLTTVSSASAASPQLALLSLNLA